MNPGPARGRRGQHPGELLGPGMSGARDLVAALEQSQDHTPDRRKTWLACDAHRESLSTFLSARGFLRDVQPFVDVEAT